MNPQIHFILVTMNSWPILFHQNPHPLCSVVPASTPTSFESNLRHFWDGEFFSRIANLFWMVIWKRSLQLGDLHFLRLWSPYGNVSLLRMGFGCTIPVKFHLFLVECEVLLFTVADRRKSREVWGLQERLTGQVLPLSLRKPARGLIQYSEPWETPAAKHSFVLPLKIPDCGKHVLSSDYLLSQNHNFLSEKVKAFPEGSRQSHCHLEVDSHSGILINWG